MASSDWLSLSGGGKEVARRSVHEEQRTTNQLVAQLTGWLWDLRVSSTMEGMADPELTKRTLLDAGRVEFARYGLAGARTDRIAATAGVNKQRMYAYFGNKEGMFQAVLADALHSLLGFVPFPQGELAAADFLRKYVAAVGAYHREHPELLRLLQWESLELGVDRVEDPARAAYYREKVAVFAKGVNQPEAEAAMLLFGVIGLAAWPNMVPQLGALILGEEEAISRSRSAEWAHKAAAQLAPA